MSNDGTDQHQQRPLPVYRAIETAPYFYGPSEWRSRNDPYIFDALAISRLSKFQDNTVLNYILHRTEFEASVTERRQQKFGPWDLQKFWPNLPSLVDEECQFLEREPDFKRNDKFDKLHSHMGRDLKAYLQSDVQSALWEEVFKPLVARKDCDVHIIGNKAFIGGVFKNAMTSNRPEPALYFNGEPENEAVRSHLGILDFTKRFWAILIHNSLPNLTMECEFHVNIRLDGSHEKSGHGLAYGDSWSISRVYEILKLLKYQGKTETLHYRIVEEEEIYTKHQVPSNKLKAYYTLTKEEDVQLLKYKLAHISQGLCRKDDTRRESFNPTVLLGPLPDGATTCDIHRGFDDIEFQGNHFWLAILDTCTGELYDHNTRRYNDYPNDDDFLANFRTNVNYFYNLHNINLPPVQDTTRVFRRQSNDYDCGYIALDKLLQFILTRATRNLGQSNNECDESRNSADEMFTADNFEEDICPSWRLAISYIAHMHDERPGSKGTVLDFSVLKRNLTEGRYTPPDSRELALTMESTIPIGQALIDPNMGHQEQLELVRYFLDHCGAVLFSFKIPPDQFEVLDPEYCFKTCDHLVDIIPIPLDYKVILQPYYPYPKDNAPTEQEMSNEKIKNLSTANDKVMIGHRNGGIYIVSNASFHGTRTPIKFNGYDLKDHQFKYFRLLDADGGWIQIGDRCWGLAHGPAKQYSEKSYILGDQHIDGIIAKYISLCGNSKTMRGWRKIGGYIYPTESAMEHNLTQELNVPRQPSRFIPPSSATSEYNTAPTTQPLPSVNLIPTTALSPTVEPSFSVNMELDKSPPPTGSTSSVTPGPSMAPATVEPPRSRPLTVSKRAFKPSKVAKPGQKKQVQSTFRPAHDTALLQEAFMQRRSELMDNHTGPPNVRHIPSNLRGFPPTTVNESRPLPPLTNSDFQIDTSAEARASRLARYKEKARDQWDRTLEKRKRVTKNDTPSYHKDKFLDTNNVDCTKDDHYFEFSSSDEDKAVRKRKRRRLAEARPGVDHQAVIRNVDVLSVVHPKGPLGYFQDLIGDTNTNDAMNANDAEEEYDDEDGGSVGVGSDDHDDDNDLCNDQSGAQILNNFETFLNDKVNEPPEVRPEAATPHQLQAVEFDTSTPLEPTTNPMVAVSYPDTEQQVKGFYMPEPQEHGEKDAPHEFEIDYNYDLGVAEEEPSGSSGPVYAKCDLPGPQVIVPPQNVSTHPPPPMRQDVNAQGRIPIDPRVLVQYDPGFTQSPNQGPSTQPGRSVQPDLRGQLSIPRQSGQFANLGLPHDNSALPILSPGLPNHLGGAMSTSNPVRPRGGNTKRVAQDGNTVPLTPEQLAAEATTKTGKKLSNGSKSIEDLGDDDLSAEALGTMRKQGWAFCSTCGTSLKSQNIETARGRHGPGSVCRLRGWKQLIRKEDVTDEMLKLREDLDKARKNGFTSLEEFYADRDAKESKKQSKKRR